MNKKTLNDVDGLITFIGKFYSQQINEAMNFDLTEYFFPKRIDEDILEEVDIKSQSVSFKLKYSLIENRIIKVLIKNNVKPDEYELVKREFKKNELTIDYSYVLKKNRLPQCNIDKIVYKEFLDKYQIGDFKKFNKNKYDNLKLLIQFLKDKNIYKN